ncbi:hypothetical protein LIA77_11187 [Sarocladium implicatum]|nr:hypothetical protein LIA77_11187 [Sarocladium implicatum]
MKELDVKPRFRPVSFDDTNFSARHRPPGRQLRGESFRRLVGVRTTTLILSFGAIGCDYITVVRDGLNATSGIVALSTVSKAVTRLGRAPSLVAWPSALHPISIRSEQERDRLATAKKTEKLLESWKHPDPYVHPTAPGGSKYERNLPSPILERQ